MWWNDISEMKEWIKLLDGRSHRIQEDIQGISQDIGDKQETLSEKLDTMHDKLNSLLNDGKRDEQITIALKTLDKFDEYMKNVDKLNLMVNEFKGCVSMARAAIGEGGKFAEEIKEIKSIAKISQEIYKSMLSFIEAGKILETKGFFKLDAIYKAICEKEPEKPKKKAGRPKKKVTSP